MTFDEYKNKVFSERPGVKTEYDKLAPEYEKTVKKLTGQNPDTKASDGTEKGV